MVNNFEVMAEVLLSTEQMHWLRSELADIQSLASESGTWPRVHEIVSENFWAPFYTRLGKKCLAENWETVEWLVARETARSAVRKSFNSVSTRVDEYPLLGRQSAQIEYHYLQRQLATTPIGAGNRRL
jgi:hypothetical protein